jgi:hypothetical protein
MTLVRGTYPTTVRLIVALRSVDAMAQNAAAEGARLDRAEAPQREADRVIRMTEANRLAAEQARVTNKALFKP